MLDWPSVVQVEYWWYCIAMVLYLSFQWLFLPDPSIRSKLTLPPRAQVDYRAACFCHRQLIDIGYVCSVCLSSKCFYRLQHSQFNDFIAEVFSFSPLSREQGKQCSVSRCFGEWLGSVYVVHTNQLTLPPLFILFLCLFLSLWPFQLYFVPWILSTTLLSHSVLLVLFLSGWSFQLRISLRKSPSALV